MSFQLTSIQKKSKLFLTASVIAISFIVATVYGKYNPISQKLKEVNTQILRERKPDLFEIKIDLNDYGLNQVEQKQLEKLYTGQGCYLLKYYSVEDIANNPELEPEKDYDKDGLTNSEEMVLNSNPKEKQTQPGFDDLVLYQDSKSPFNSRIIDKQKLFYINQNYVQDEGESLSKILNQKCEEGLNFFELFNSERISTPNTVGTHLGANQKSFNLFFKKNIELIKNRELDIFLHAFDQDQTLAIEELGLTNQKIEELQTFIIEKEDSKNYLLLNDFYKKLIELYSNSNIEQKADIYKEIIYILAQLKLT